MNGKYCCHFARSVNQGK